MDLWNGGEAQGDALSWLISIGPQEVNELENEHGHPKEKTSRRQTGDAPAEKKWPGWPGENVFRLIMPVGSNIGHKGELIKKMCEEMKSCIKILKGIPSTTTAAKISKRKEVEDEIIVEGTTNHNSESYNERQRQSEVPAEGKGQSEFAHARNNSTSVKGNGMPFKHHSTQSKSQKIGANFLEKVEIHLLKSRSQNSSECDYIKGILKAGKRDSIGVRPADDEAVGSAARHINASERDSGIFGSPILHDRSAKIRWMSTTSRL
eukprot:Gb_17824 [translate_table: standard]